MINGLISLASNLDNPNLLLSSESVVGIHAEKAGAVLYVFKCAKVPIKIANFAYCTEEVPVLMENSTVIKFLNPITQVVYPNYTLTVCDPVPSLWHKRGNLDDIWNG